MEDYELRMDTIILNRDNQHNKKNYSRLRKQNPNTPPIYIKNKLEENIGHLHSKDDSVKDEKIIARLNYKINDIKISRNRRVRHIKSFALLGEDI
jgi:hypothetical protein